MTIQSTIDRRAIAVRSFTLAAFALGAACAPAGDKPASTESAAPATSEPAKLVAILSPTEGDTVGPNIAVTLGATGVTIEKASGVRAEGIGHHHLFLDTDPTAADAPIPPATPTVVHLGTGANEYTFTAIAPGPHRIIAVIAWGDHVPMVGVRTDTVNVVVKK